MVADCFMSEEICHGAKGHRCNHVDNLNGELIHQIWQRQRRVKVVRRKRVFGTGVGNLTPLINKNLKTSLTLSQC